MVVFSQAAPTLGAVRVIQLGITMVMTAVSWDINPVSLVKHIQLQAIGRLSTNVYHDSQRMQPNGPNNMYIVLNKFNVDLMPQRPATATKPLNRNHVTPEQLLYLRSVTQKPSGSVGHVGHIGHFRFKYEQVILCVWEI